MAPVTATMRAPGRHISGGTEFVLVITACFWWAIAANAGALFARAAGAGAPQMTVDDGRIMTVVVMELIGLGVASLVGWARGWTVFTFGLKPTWRATAAGVVLAVAVFAGAGGFGLLVNAAWPGAVRFGRLPGVVNVWSAVALAIVNPVVEEVFEVGYIFHAISRLRKRHATWIAILASATLRTTFHAYQGLNALVIIFPLGIAFALVYRRTRNLWPLIVAHALFDLWALLPMRA
jgi:membrane protease YdiL (CAAX protease family)